MSKHFTYLRVAAGTMQAAAAGSRGGIEVESSSTSLVMTLLISVFFGESVRGMGFQGSDSEGSNWTRDFPTR